MSKVPNFNYPYRYPSYYTYSHFSKSHQQNSNNTKSEKNNNDFIEKEVLTAEKKQSKNRYTNRKSIPIFPVFFDMDGFSDIEKPVLEILGIKLYQDDLIIFALLFILYKENVKDELLFMSLILLLIS